MRVALWLCVPFLLLVETSRAAETPPDFWLATFSVDVTIPLGHPCMGGGISPAVRIDDPLLARGVVLGGRGLEPLVICGVDWCEIRNEAYEHWRAALADAAGTTPLRVLVSCLHQHDAPVVDLVAEQLLKEHGLQGSVCDIEFHEQTVKRVATELKVALERRRRVTHYGTGQAEVSEVASNRRYHDSQGNLRFDRTSASRDPEAHAGEPGTVDPWLKTVSFWDGDLCLAAISHFATHPMSYYGKGGVSSDFVGLARRRRQEDIPETFRIYLSGCSGNVTAGKYNDGSPENRPRLAERIYRAMVAADEATRRQPLERIAFRAAKLRLAPRASAGFSPAELEARLRPEARSFDQCLAAMGLSWRRRCEAGLNIDVPVIDLGQAALLLLPGESYVEYQLYAQQACPDKFVVAIGYGESATGYIPTERAWEEHDTNLHDWCWVAPGAESLMRRAIDEALQSPAGPPGR
ncbi:MAG: hypothetical protein K1X74_17000 [Pirellulales bacterium]|nr:hypothetical protein [Pirellulales bacterium]